MIDGITRKNNLQKFNSISELHKGLGLPKPLHPLISIITHTDITSETNIRNLIPNFYMISYKSNLSAKLKYGQGYYDFNEGGLIFISPNQAISIADDTDACYGFSLFIHPDFINTYSVGKSIKNFGFFSYNINEALHLSDSEKNKVTSIFEDIRQELNTSIDEISQDLIVSYIDVLLNYSNRYYKRQFITRKIVNNSIIEKFESLLVEHFNSDETQMKGLPSVKQFSDKLNISASYLSDLLRNLTGQNTQQHIHLKLIDKAKEKLSNTNLTVAEIAYELGFEYPQSFTKLFKAKTNVTPLEYRVSVN